MNWEAKGEDAVGNVVYYSSAKVSMVAAVDVEYSEGSLLCKNDLPSGYQGNFLLSFLPFKYIQYAVEWAVCQPHLRFPSTAHMLYDCTVRLHPRRLLDGRLLSLNFISS